MLVGVGMIIFLVLMSIAANCGCIPVIQALVVSHIVRLHRRLCNHETKLLGTINEIHFNTVRGMSVTSIASITSYVESCINQLRRILCYVWLQSLVSSWDLKPWLGDSLDTSSSTSSWLWSMPFQDFDIYVWSAALLRHVEQASRVSCPSLHSLGAASLNCNQSSNIPLILLGNIQPQCLILENEHLLPLLLMVGPRLVREDLERRGSTIDARQGEVDDIMIHLLLLWTSWCGSYLILAILCWNSVSSLILESVPSLEEHWQDLTAQSSSHSSASSSLA